MHVNDTDSDENVEILASNNELADQIKTFINELPERERLVLTKRFGLTNDE